MGHITTCSHRVTSCLLSTPSPNMMGGWVVWLSVCLLVCMSVCPTTSIHTVVCYGSISLDTFLPITGICWPLVRFDSKQRKSQGWEQWKIVALHSVGHRPQHNHFHWLSTTRFLLSAAQIGQGLTKSWEERVLCDVNFILEFVLTQELQDTCISCTVPQAEFWFTIWPHGRTSNKMQVKTYDNLYLFCQVRKYVASWRTRLIIFT